MRIYRILSGLVVENFILIQDEYSVHVLGLETLLIIDSVILPKALLNYNLNCVNILKNDHDRFLILLMSHENACKIIKIYM